MSGGDSPWGDCDISHHALERFISRSRLLGIDDIENPIPAMRDLLHRASFLDINDVGITPAVEAGDSIVVKSGRWIFMVKDLAIVTCFPINESVPIRDVFEKITTIVIDTQGHVTKLRSGEIGVEDVGFERRLDSKHLINAFKILGFRGDGDRYGYRRVSYGLTVKARVPVNLSDVRIVFVSDEEKEFSFRVDEDPYIYVGYGLAKDEFEKLIKFLGNIAEVLERERQARLKALEKERLSKLQPQVLHMGPAVEQEEPVVVRPSPWERKLSKEERRLTSVRARRLAVLDDQFAEIVRVALRKVRAGDYGSNLEAALAPAITDQCRLVLHDRGLTLPD